jgi:hypothetical protein
MRMMMMAVEEVLIDCSLFGAETCDSEILSWVITDYFGGRICCRWGCTFGDRGTGGLVAAHHQGARVEDVVETHVVVSERLIERIRGRRRCFVIDWVRVNKARRERLGRRVDWASYHIRMHVERRIHVVAISNEFIRYWSARRVGV